MRTRMLRKLGEQQSSPDLDRRQVLLCLGYAENFLAIGLLGRLHLSNVAAEIKSMQLLTRALESDNGRQSPLIAEAVSEAIVTLQAAHRAASFQSLTGTCESRTDWAKVCFFF
jgi:hypothetical protein